MHKIDALFIHPGKAKKLYQDLSKDYAAIEPNIWAGMLANSCRNQGFDVAVLDANVERLNDEEVALKVEDYNPRFAIFVVTGQNPNASTYMMDGAVSEAEAIKKLDKDITIVFVGPHVNALPVETLQKHSCIDICCVNEGVYAIWNLLESKNLNHEICDIPGIAYSDEERTIYLNNCSSIVPQNRLEQDLPGVAWDLLPSLDKYRTGLWHCDWNPDENTPFASLYTSLGCPMRCEFCMINIINRTDNDYCKSARDYNTWRCWSPEFIIKQFDYLASVGVKQIKLADEMWVYKPKHFLKICDLIIERGYDFNIWAYARVDMTKPEYLSIMKKAGVNMLGLGIESGNKKVRSNVTKGNFGQDDIRDVVQRMKDYGINVGGNYLFGLTGDTYDTMQETLDLALELQCENSNFYATVAFPGSALYLKAKRLGWELPQDYAGYSFYARNHIPLRTEKLTSAQILKFRDEAFQTYFTDPSYLSMIKAKFGQVAMNAIGDMTKIKLERNI